MLCFRVWLQTTYFLTIFGNQIVETLNEEMFGTYAGQRIMTMEMGYEHS